MSNPHPSVLSMSKEFFASIGKEKRELISYYFCDNEKDANECADLVLLGEKRATASSMWWYETNNEKLPEVGDYSVITNWAGKALCVTEVEKVEITAFKDINNQFAEIEGEGDKSLAYWKKVHWDYYTREMHDSGDSPSEDMLIVCEYFKVIFPI